MKSMKTYAARILVLFTFFALVFTAGCDDKPKQAGVQEKKAPLIGIFLFNEDVYIASVAVAFRAALSGRAEVEEYSASNEQLTQNEQIDAMLARAPDVLVVNLVEVQTGGYITDRAKKAGIPVVFFNREPDLQGIASYDKTCFVGTIPLEAGKMQGDIIKRLWDKHPEYDRNKDGKFQYVMVQANVYSPEALARTEYSVRQARELGVVMEQVGNTLLGDWNEEQAFEAMRLALTSIGDRVELVIANNDAMAVGAIAALAETGFNTGEPGAGFIPVIGVDATEQGMEAIRRGTMSGTVKQDGRLMGETLAAFALNSIAGEDFLEGTGLQWDESGIAVRLPYSVLEAE